MEVCIKLEISTSHFSSIWAKFPQFLKNRVSNLATVISRGCSRMEGARLPAMRGARRTSKDKEEKEGVRRTSRADREDFAIFRFFQSPLSKDLLTATACFTLSPDH